MGKTLFLVRFDSVSGLVSASKNINDWWLSYWVTHAHSPQNHSHDSPLFYIAHTTHTITTNTTSTDSITTDTIIGHALPWSNVTESHDNVTFYLTVYGSLAAVNSVMTFIRAFTFAYGGVRAARMVHEKLLSRILKVGIL